MRLQAGRQSPRSLVHLLLVMCMYLLHALVPYLVKLYSVFASE